MLKLLAYALLTLYYCALEPMTGTTPPHNCIYPLKSTQRQGTKTRTHLTLHTFNIQQLQNQLYTNKEYCEFHKSNIQWQEDPH